MTLPQAIADPRASQRNATRHERRAGVPLDPAAHAAGGARPPRSRTRGEIGAATGIEFLPGGGVLAAAEPVRRGTGSALVVNRSPNPG